MIKAIKIGYNQSQDATGNNQKGSLDCDVEHDTLEKDNKKNKVIAISHTNKFSKTSGFV